jgi:hypothetical protein
MEVVCTHMFLTGAAKRQRDDWQEILLSTSPPQFPSFLPLSSPHSFPTLRIVARPIREEQLTKGLPFQSDCNTGFGIVFSYYLNVTLYNFRESTKDTTPQTPDSADSEPNAITESNKDTDAVKQAKEDALKAVETLFQSVKGARQEVERGFRFWDAVCLFSTSPSSQASLELFLIHRCWSRYELFRNFDLRLKMLCLIKTSKVCRMLNILWASLRVQTSGYSL